MSDETTDFGRVPCACSIVVFVIRLAKGAIQEVVVLAGTVLINASYFLESEQMIEKTLTSVALDILPLEDGSCCLELGKMLVVEPSCRCVPKWG